MSGEEEKKLLEENGKHIRFWIDRWLPSMEPLYNIVSTQLSPFEMDMKIWDYMLNENWNFQIV